jgi:beta-N-acetylhexosaminidase
VQAGKATDTVIAAIEREAAEAGREMRRIGVTLNLAPLAEVLTEKNQPFLKARAYGPDMAFTTNAAAAFIRGMNEAKIASTIKHFPGNSGIDPHYHMAVLDIPEAELEEMIKPFRELIQREAPASVMVSHVIVPSWDSISLTRSPIAVKRIRDMGFDGIIMADCFAMAATGAPPEVAVVEALAAGVDMVMTWPNNIQKVYGAIIKALKAGTLSEERIREAAGRVIYQKMRYGVVE